MGTQRNPHDTRASRNTAQACPAAAAGITLIALRLLLPAPTDDARTDRPDRTHLSTSSETPEHEIDIWRLTSRCGHVVERSAHRSGPDHQLSGEVVDCEPWNTRRAAIRSDRIGRAAEPPHQPRPPRADRTDIKRAKSELSELEAAVAGGQEASTRPGRLTGRLPGVDPTPTAVGPERTRWSLALWNPCFVRVGALFICLGFRVVERWGAGAVFGVARTTQRRDVTGGDRHLDSSMSGPGCSTNCIGRSSTASAVEGTSTGRRRFWTRHTSERKNGVP